MPHSVTHAKRGRPRLHRDAATRAQAYRDRLRGQASAGEMARVVLDRPTPLLVRRMAAKLCRQAEDPAAAAEAVMRALLEGVEEGGGQQAVQAARNVVRWG